MYKRLTEIDPAFLFMTSLVVGLVYQKVQDQTLKSVLEVLWFTLMTLAFYIWWKR